MSTSSPPPGIPEAVRLSTQTWQNDLLQLCHEAKDRFPDVVWELHSDDNHDSTEDIWGHKAIVRVRAPPSFQARYLSTPPAFTNQGSILRIPLQISSALFSSELEYLYSAKGLAEAFEFLFDVPESHVLADAEESRLVKLRNDLFYLWRSRQFSDVRITLTGTFSLPNTELMTAVFSTHRFILASRSPYFRSQLSESPIVVESSSPGEPLTLPLPSPPFTPPSVYFTLGYIYTGTLAFSDRTYDLDTAFGILRSASYLSLPQLYDEIQARIVDDMLHGLFHALVEFSEYERITNSKWGIGGCRCRRCARRVPRVLEFAISDDVQNNYLERGCRRALVGLFGEGWCNAEFAALPQKIRDSAIKGVTRRTMPTNVFPLLFAAQHAMRKLSVVRDGWADVSREDVLTARKTIDECLVKESETCFEQPEWVEMLESDGIGFGDAEKVDWVMEALMRGMSERYAVTVYQTLVSSILLRPHATGVGTTMVSQTSPIRVQVEGTRIDLMRWIRKRWIGIRQDGGFDGLEGWTLKEISQEIEVPVEDLLAPAPQRVTLQRPKFGTRLVASRSGEDGDGDGDASVRTTRRTLRSSAALRPAGSALRNRLVTSRANDRLETASVTAVFNGVMGTPTPRRMYRRLPLPKTTTSTLSTGPDSAASEKDSDGEGTDTVPSLRPSIVQRSAVTSRHRGQESGRNFANSVRTTSSVGGSTQPLASTSRLIPQDAARVMSVRSIATRRGVSHVAEHRKPPPLTDIASTRSTEDHGSHTCKKDSDDDHESATPPVALAQSWRPTLPKIVTDNLPSIDSASPSTEQHSIRSQHSVAHRPDHPAHGLVTLRTPSSPAGSNTNLSPAISDASFGTAQSELDSLNSDGAQSRELSPNHGVHEHRGALDNTTDINMSGSTTVPASRFIQTPESHAREWTKTKLARDPWKDALASAADFTLPRVIFYQIICERLETNNCITDAADCFCQMTNELGAEPKLPGEHSVWAFDFRQRICKKLEFLGDTAVDAQRHREATSHYTTVLSLNPPSPQNIFMKRSKAYTAIGSWEHALDDANQVIMLDPSSPWGYEMKHAALHIAGDYNNAVDAFKLMLLNVERSSDPEICQHRDQYKTPSRIRTRIRRIVQRTLRDSPHALINTTTGRLYNRDERASAFESLPIFNELVSSMTTRIDRTRIKHEVRQYFQYAVLSHRWEDNEPSFQQIIHVAVYDLDQCPTHDKLQTFCKIARDAGFQWAWSDTCCIDTGKHDVHQEALVAMFKWYRGSAMMIVFLRGVASSSQCGALAGSVWNTRGWTLQEYIAAKVIHFYTEDWTVYLNLESPNHKEAPEVISEMEQSTGVSSQQLKALRPGLTNIREKLRLASTRRTTRVEDTAYSLLGIFSVTGIPAIYGEGEAALGRLLSHILTGSGDVSILAWTGESGSFNSCLPAHITVFNRPAASHLPPPIEESEMEWIITKSQTPSFDLDVALKLYDHLNEVPAPWFAASRMKLPCIMFQLPSLSTPHRTRSGRIYHLDTVTFGMVEIKTRHDLSRLNSLYLVHPWLDTLLEPDHAQSIEDHDVPPPSPDTDEDEISDEEVYRYSVPSGPSRDATMHSVNMAPVPLDKETRARRLVARLRQPFGALLVTPTSTGRRAADYRRVAADSLIIVRFQNTVSLADLLDNVRVLDIL